jgi:nitrous oxidase accessory protein NosD
MKRSTPVLVGLLLAFVGTSESFAETITVCPTGCDYTSIQDAINDSSNGDVIQIASGTFNEHSLNPGGKNLTIQGTLDSDGQPTTTIDANQSGSVFYSTQNSGNNVIKDLIITGGIGTTSAAGWVGGGGIFIDVYAPTTTIQNCTVTGNSSGAYGGGIFVNAAEVSIIDCTITNNEAGVDAGNNYSGGGGIYCQSMSYTITNCTITNNSCFKGQQQINPCGGLQFGTSMSLSLEGNTISDNQYVGSGWSNEVNLVVGSSIVYLNPPATGACCFNDGCFTTTE